MSEFRSISPMLDGFTMGQPISDHSGVECCPAMRNDSDKRYIVKRISLPASQVQAEALLLTGVYQDAQAVSAYYKELAYLVREEVRILDQLAGKRGFVPYLSCQIVPMADGIGSEVYLLSRYRKTLERQTRRGPMTHLAALNLGIDLCAALAVCREAGWLYVDLKPENIFLVADQEYRIGDLGFVGMDILEYTSLPDRYRSLYTAPEVADAYSNLNATMDTYALGLILYQIYNEGQLPFTDEEGRRAWLAKLEAGEPMAAPRCADPEIAQIICKACAYSPADRWQTPAQMGHALIGYMQRCGAEDIPIAPRPDAANPVEETSAETAESNATVGQNSENPANSRASLEPSDFSAAGSDPAVEHSSDSPPGIDGKVEKTVEKTADWIDLMDAFLSESGEAPGEGSDGPSLRKLLQDTGDLPDEELAAVELSGDAADIISVADKLIEHDAPAPVVVPEPIDIPIPEPILPSQAEPDDATAPPAPAKKPRGVGKLLRMVLALAAVAGLILGVWYYYQNIYLQTIDSMTSKGSSKTLTVTVDTDMDEGKLTVVCKDTYGNAVNGTLENGSVTFSDLVPGTQYLITLEPKGLHKLVGTTSITYSTPAETKLLNMTAITGQEPGSALVSFGVEGQDSAEWTLLCEAEGQEPRSIPFTGHTVTVTGLTIGTEYTMTLSAADVLLVGQTVITHTASDLVLARDLALSGYQDGTLTVNWAAPEGITVDRWMVRCTDGGGYDQLQEVSGCTASFDGITVGSKYTVEVTADGMTQSVRTDITIDSSSITGFIAALDGSAIVLSWDHDGHIPQGGWKILWNADGGEQQLLTAQENRATLSPAAPGSSYRFTLQPPEGSSLLASSCTLEVPPAGSFQANGFDSGCVSVKMYGIPEAPVWGCADLQDAETVSTFAPGGALALLYTSTGTYVSNEDEHETLFVIRDSEGRLVSASSRTRRWDQMWTDNFCTESVTNLPMAPGSYTLTVLISGGVLTELPFTIR